MNIQNEEMMSFKEKSEFIGYHTLKAPATVIAIFQNGERVQKLRKKLCSYLINLYSMRNRVVKLVILAILKQRMKSKSGKYHKIT